MNDAYSIQQIAKEFSVTPRTLRFYEAKGLLAPARDGQSRRYSDRDRIRLRLALRGKRLGFSLEECRNIIEMYDSPDYRSDLQLLHLCEKIREHRAQLLQKMHDIEITLRTMDEVEQKCLMELNENANRREN